MKQPQLWTDKTGSLLVSKSLHVLQRCPADYFDKVWGRQWHDNVVVLTIERPSVLDDAVNTVETPVPGVVLVSCRWEFAKPGDEAINQAAVEYAKMFCGGMVGGEWVMRLPKQYVAEGKVVTMATRPYLHVLTKYQLPTKHKVRSIERLVKECPSIQYRIPALLRLISNEDTETLCELYDYVMQSVSIAEMRGLLYICANCSGAALMLNACSRCRSIHYCSAQCQRVHWIRVHRQRCQKHK